MDDDWVQAQWQQWMMGADRPSIDGLNMYVVSGAVSDMGTKVALSGLGADELFGGYGHFRTIHDLRRMLRPVGWMPRGVRRSLVRVAAAVLSPTRRQRAVALASAGTTPLDLLLFFRRLTVDDDMRRLGFDAESLGLLPNFLCPSAVESLRATAGDESRQISQAECILYMGNTLLRDADTNSMAHSLEVRVPFLGRRLVELACSLPGSLQSPPGSLPKHLLRQAVAEKIPATILVRPKKGFSLPIGDWMRTSLRKQCEAAVEELAACSLFLADATRQLYDGYLSQGDRVHWTRPLALVALGNYLIEMKRRAPARPTFDDRLPI
jgi:asparagine synthase (glutamine-hydrolysing)